MSWFSRLRNWQTDQANGIGIRSDYHDSEDDNFATGINASINVAGGNVPTANLPMGGFKHTGAADGSAITDYATLGQLRSYVQTQSSVYAIDSAGTDTYAITLSPAITSYTTGQIFRFYPATANTGAATLNVNAIGAKTIKKHKDVDLSDNDIKIGQLVEVIYDGTNMQMLSPLYGVVTQNGAATFAADAGASDSYAITLSPVPPAYVTGMSIYFKANTANTGAATLNVNSLGAKTIKKSVSSDLETGDLAANQIINVVYDGTNFQLASGAGGGGDKMSKSITQATHGLAVGDVVRFNGTDYVKAQANSAANAEVVGIVYLVSDADNFTLLFGGKVSGLSALIAGTVYFLSPSSAGALTATEPSTAGQVSKPLLVADSTTSGYLYNYRGTTITASTVNLTAASQSEMESESSTTGLFVGPNVVKYSPGVSKFWVQFTSITTTAIITSYNVSSLVDIATGRTTINIANDFSSTNYCVLGMTFTAGTTSAGFAQANGTPSAGAIDVRSSSAGDVATDFIQYYAGFGDQ